MKRRRLLKLTLVSVPVIVAMGLGVRALRPGIVDGRLTPTGNSVFRAIALAVLDGSLPKPPAELRLVMDAHMRRLDGTISGLSSAARSELSQLLGLLAHPVGRVAFAALPMDWDNAPSTEVNEALEGLRRSSFKSRQQAYHALRDLTNAAFYADAQAWPLMAYPGPRDV